MRLFDLKKNRKVSLFDLDQTLLKENGSCEFGTYLFKHHVFPLSSMLYYVGCYAFHKVGKLSMQSLHKKIFSSLFRGKPADPFKQLAASFIKEKFDDMLYLPAVQRLNNAKREGHYTGILSSSPDFLVQLMATHFEVDEWAATFYITDKNDNFVKVSEIMCGDAKSRYLYSLSEKLEIPTSDFTAYSDSYLDLPFLEAAGTAVGVNPDNKLRAICKKNQWEII